MPTPACHIADASRADLLATMIATQIATQTVRARHVAGPPGTPASGADV